MKPADLIVSPGPHWHSGARKTTIAYHTMLALVPAAVWGITQYGLDAVRVISLSIACAMLAEWGFRKLVRKPDSLADGTAALSGLLLALILPASTPWHMILIGNVLGIVVGKECFGGLGANPLNPVLVGYAALRITTPWAGHLDFDLALINYQLGYPLEFPLAVLRAKGATALGQFPLGQLFLGQQTGGIGAVGMVWLLIGGLYLVLRGFAPWRIPLAFLLGSFVTSGIFWLANGELHASPLFHLLTGNLMIGAFFLATDPSSSPVNRWPQLIFGFACGLLAILLRAWSNYADGVVFAILLMNLCVPLLDQLTVKQRHAPRAAVPSALNPPATEEGAAS
ncbi:MAG: electron transporter RnfD [Candidatus Eisenbacteria bacterium]|nr:electron transporter RnfD [Candidatus Eisenbacteria bacterium]